MRRVRALRSVAPILGRRRPPVARSCLRSEAVSPPVPPDHVMARTQVMPALEKLQSVDTRTWLGHSRTTSSHRPSAHLSQSLRSYGAPPAGATPSPGEDYCGRPGRTRWQSARARVQGDSRIDVGERPPASRRSAWPRVPAVHFSGRGFFDKKPRRGQASYSRAALATSVLQAIPVITIGASNKSGRHSVRWMLRWFRSELMSPET